MIETKIEILQVLQIMAVKVTNSVFIIHGIHQVIKGCVYRGPKLISLTSVS